MAKSDLKDLLHRYLTGNVTERERIKFETWLEMMRSDKTLPRYLSVEEENVLAAKIMSDSDSVDEIKAYRPEGLKLADDTTDREQIKFETWMEIVKSDKAVPRYMSAEDDKELGDKIMTKIDSVDEIKTYQPETEKPKTIFFDFRLRVAATIVILLGVGIIIWSQQKSKQQNEWYAGGGDQKIALTDGSIVWLKQGSKFTFNEDTNLHVRTASLTGEGLFEIAKDPSNPFTIVCGIVKVTVVGTSFTLKTISDGIDLHLLTGKVILSSSLADGQQEILPLQHAVYTSKGILERSVFKDVELPSLTANTAYLMRFENVPLKNVFEKLERKFDVHVNVVNPRMQTCRINADFTDYSLEQTMVLLKAALLDFDYVISGKSINVSGNGCKTN